jgi:hypothetical protein
MSAHMTEPRCWIGGSQSGLGFRQASSLPENGFVSRIGRSYTNGPN